MKFPFEVELAGEGGQGVVLAAIILADAAASVSPLSKTPHRYLSGKLAIQELLTAMQGTSTGLPT